MLPRLSVKEWAMNGVTQMLRQETASLSRNNPNEVAD